MTFLAPLFLAGLLGLVVPWILHRLKQHDAPVQDFPSDQFLRATATVSQRRKKLRYLKLLALRLLFVLLLCLLFAEPVIQRVQDLLGSNELHAIVLDRSFSMRANGRWDEAVELVKQVVAGLPGAAEVQLYSAASTLVSESPASTDRSQIAAALASLRPGNQRLQFGYLMQKVNELGNDSKQPVIVHLVTDAQASGIPARNADLLAPGLGGFELYPVGSGTEANSALSVDVIARDEDTFDLVAQVTTFAADAVPDEQVIDVYRGDELLASKRVEAASTAGGSMTYLAEFASLTWPLNSEIEQFRVVRSPEDSLPEDDTVHLGVQAEAITEIAIISTNHPAGRSPGQLAVEELYLRTALQIDPRNRVSVHAPGDRSIPGSVDVIVYVDSLPLQQGELPELRGDLAQYLQDGVHILYVLNAAGYNLNTSAVVSSASGGHPLGLSVSAWQDVRFFAQHPLPASGAANSTAEVLLTSSADSAVLLEQSESSARLLWLNASLDSAANSLPVSPVFVPFLDAVIEYFVRADEYPRQLAVGSSIRLKKALQLLDPDQQPLLELSARGREQAQLLHRPGVYTILESDRETPVNVALDLAESDLRAVDEQTRLRWQSAQPVATDATALSPGETESGGGEKTRAETSRTLTLWLLPACLILLLLESLYANWHLRARRTS